VNIPNPHSKANTVSTFFDAPTVFEKDYGKNRALFSRYTLQSGLQLLKSSMQANESKSTTVILQNCHLGILVNGEVQVPQVDGHPISMSPGSWFIAGPYLSPLKILPLSNLELFTIECETETLKLILQQTRGKEYYEKKRLLHGPGNGRLRKLSIRIQNCPTERLSDRLTLEALSLRWLAELVEQPEINNSSACANTCPTTDSAAVMTAARFLSENLQEEHSITALSRRVHLNEFKLKKGFQHLYDSTIFKYLREERMEKAAKILRESNKNVAEVANLVGYSNPSHFARAFKDRHGILPKRYQKEANILSESLS